MYNTVICCTHNFIITAVKDTWICELRDPISRYNDDVPRAIMLHLTTACVGIYALDVLTLQNAIHQYHTEYMSIPMYINALEDAQKLSGQEGNKITDAKLLLIATTAMFPTQRLESANNKREEKDHAEKTLE